MQPHNLPTRKRFIILENTKSVRKPISWGAKALWINTKQMKPTGFSMMSSFTVFTFYLEQQQKGLFDAIRCLWFTCFWIWFPTRHNCLSRILLRALQGSNTNCSLNVCFVLLLHYRKKMSAFENYRITHYSLALKECPCKSLSNLSFNWILTENVWYKIIWIIQYKDHHSRCQ